jgi:hypothetical protein
MGSDLVFLFCLQNGTLTDPRDKVALLVTDRTPVPSICAGRMSGGGWIYGGWIWFMRIQSQHTNVGCLAVLSRSQVTWVNVQCRLPM